MSKKYTAFCLSSLLLALTLLWTGITPVALGSIGYSTADNSILPERLLETWQAELASNYHYQAVPEPQSGNATAGLTSTTLISVATGTELRQADPNTNLWNELPIYIGFRDGQRSRVLLDIPLWDLPPNVTIDNAILRFAIGGWYDYVGQERTITAYRVTSIWNESLATWNHAPTTAEAIGSVSVRTPQQVTWYSIDLTNQVQAWYSEAQPNYGVVLVGPEEGEPVYRIISSDETTDYPRLEVTYTAMLPTLSAGPTALTFLADSQSGPQSQQVRIANTGSTSLDWQATVGVTDWIVLGSNSGTINAGQSRAIDININKSALGLGLHTGEIQISSVTVGVQGTPQVIPVTFIYASDLKSVYLPLILRDFGNTTSIKKAVALLIGISNYQYLSPAPPGSRAGEWGYDLMYARNDAERTSVVLQNLGFFTSIYSGNEILMLTDSQAKLEDIRAAFEWLDAHEDQDTVVIVAYSGHGGQIQDDNGDEGDGWDEFIAAYDTNEVGNTYVDMMRDDELNTHLSALDSKQVVVILDSCFSGGMNTATLDSDYHSASRGLPLPGSDSALLATTAIDEIALDIVSTNRVIVTASAADQASMETGEFGHGVFTYFLLMAWMDPAADLNYNGWVSIEEAYAYLASKVDAYVFSRIGTHQNPQIYDNVPSNVDITHP